MSLPSPMGSKPNGRDPPVLIFDMGETIAFWREGPNKEMLWRQRIEEGELNKEPGYSTNKYMCSLKGKAHRVLLADYYWCLSFEADDFRDRIREIHDGIRSMDPGYDETLAKTQDNLFINDPTDRPYLSIDLNPKVQAWLRKKATVDTYKLLEGIGFRVEDAFDLIVPVYDFHVELPLESTPEAMALSQIMKREAFRLQQREIELAIAEGSMEKMVKIVERAIASLPEGQAEAKERLNLIDEAELRAKLPGLARVFGQMADDIGKNPMTRGPMNIMQAEMRLWDMECDPRRSYGISTYQQEKLAALETALKHFTNPHALVVGDMNCHEGWATEQLKAKGHDVSFLYVPGASRFASIGRRIRALEERRGISGCIRRSEDTKGDGYPKYAPLKEYPEIEDFAMQANPKMIADEKLQAGPLQRKAVTKN